MNPDNAKQPTATGGGEVELIADDDGGMLCVGDRQDVEVYLTNLTELATEHGQTAPVSLSNVTRLAALGSTFATHKATSGTYFRLPAESETLLRRYAALPGRGDAIRGVVRGSDGQIKGLLQFKKVTLTAERAASIQLMMVTATLQASIKDVERAVERVGEKVNELTKKVDADWKGNVVGVHNMLCDAVRSVEEHGVLTDVMWDGVCSSLGDISHQIAKVREYLDLQVRSLQDDTLGAPNAKERAERLAKLVDSNMIGEALQLLVIVEDSRYLWHRLAVERTVQASPDQLDIVTATAKAHLRQDIVDDQAMLNRLYDLLQSYGSRNEREILRFRSGGKMELSVAQLRDAFEAFREARRLQVIAWEDPHQPTLRSVGDAAKQRATKAIDATQAGWDHTVDLGQRSGRAIGIAATVAGGQARDAGQAVARAWRDTRSGDRD